MKQLRSVLLVGLQVAICASATAAEAQTRRVNAPYFPSTVRSSEAAVLWFGRVDPLQNYADVRVAYTEQEVWIKLAIFDQWLWEDDAPTRTPASLEAWDAATVVLDTNGTASGLPSSGTYRFVGELSWWRPRTDYQAAYRGTGAGWSHSVSTPFTTETGWRGDAPNNGNADRGWVITFRIPFTSLGLAGPPAIGTVWRLGVQLHDKDSQASPAVSNQAWPDGFNRDQTGSWGQIGFGLRPEPTQPPPPGAQTHTIRHNLGGAVVPDAMVGGGANCGGSADFFSTWGANNFAHSTELVVQNQADVADWPCFSKVYLDFPLDGLPAGKSVISASLTLYQFGGSDPSQAQRSLVQVFTVGEAWNESSITWNTAPLAVENVGQTWVDVIPSPGLPWPGAARTWNISWAVTQAYVSGLPYLRLALYGADAAYHSGKYFTSSDTGTWNEGGRPALRVILADAGTPPGAPRNLRITK